MTHLNMEQLLALREPGLEPGREAALTHFEGCAQCRTEADRLGQRVAHLRTLPTPRPARDHFAVIRSRHLRERRLRQLRVAGWAGLALAASLTLVVGLRNFGATPEASSAVAGAGEDELWRMMARSRELEATIRAWDPDSRVIDGRTTAISLRLEQQLGAVDRELEMIGALGSISQPNRAQQLRLWRERVGLLDGLMDVHLTRASFAGL